MFSGIVQNKTPVKIEKSLNLLKTFSIALLECQRIDLQIGGSIALNGVCLTVTKIDQNRAFFDVMMETLRLTNLGELTDGQSVNVERAAKFGDDIGGHSVSGHVSSTVTVSKIERPENNCIIWFSVTPDQRKYLFNKGFVSLNGCSLTIGEVTDHEFNVYLIPETLQVTVFGESSVGDSVNIEFDAHTQAIVDTLERMKAEGAL